MQFKLTIAKDLQAANPHLKAGDGCVTAAKNFRIELKRAYTQIKFADKPSRLASGDAVHVIWTDGTSVAEVETISKKYQGG